MTRLLHRQAPWIVAFVVAMIVPIPRPARADVLAEYLFWDRMGHAAGNAVGHYQDYRRERQLWSDKIAAAKAELARCGGCASARAELEKWQGIENKFQDVAGGLAASVGMPREVADFLGIKKSLFPPSSLVQRGQGCALNVPTWTEQRPPSCQSAVQEHFTCLRRFQKATGVCSVSAATEVGGACWQTRKLFLTCAAQDYKAFEREKAAEALRRSDPTIPEVIDEEGANVNLVIYDHADDDFTLPMPPKHVIDEAFKEKDTLREIHFTVKRSTRGPLWAARIQSFFWNMVAPNSRCFEQNRPGDEVTNRICEDLYATRYQDLRVIACWYGSPQGGEPPDAVYWYEKRVPLVDAGRLLRRDRSHPLLRVGDVRSDCPRTKDEAADVAQQYQARLASLGVPQIPESQALPRSDFMQDRDRQRKEAHEADIAARLATFPIEGWYTWERTRNNGRSEAADCLIKSVGEHRYEIKCKGRRNAFSGDAGIEKNGLHVSWSDGTDVFFKDGTSYSAGKGGAKVFGKRKLTAWHSDDPGSGRGWAWHYGRVAGEMESLSRNGTVLPKDFVELVRGFPFEGNYRLEAEYQGDKIALFCKVERNSSYRPNAFLQLCYDKDGHLFKAEAHPEQRGEGQPVLNASRFSPDVIVGGDPVIGILLPFDPSSSDPDKSAFETTTERGIHVRLTRASGDTQLSFTPVEELGFRPIDTKSLRKRGIDTAEQLSALSNEEARSLGFTQGMRDAARDFLAAKERTERDANVKAPKNATARLGSEAEKATGASPGPARSSPSVGKASSPLPDKGVAKCPTNFLNLHDPDAELDCQCAPGAHVGILHGTDVYTDVSSICRAARHAGMIDEAGGIVHVKGVPGLRSYRGVERNGIRSSGFGPRPYAFRFVGQGQKGDSSTGSQATAPSDVQPENCPAMFANFHDALGKFACTCTSGVPKGTIYGADVYTDDSALCTAARHAGRIGERGGVVHVEGVPGAKTYAGVTRNGVSSRGYGPWPRAFRFVDASGPENVVSSRP